MLYYYRVEFVSKPVLQTQYQGSKLCGFAILGVSYGFKNHKIYIYILGNKQNQPDY